MALCPSCGEPTYYVPHILPVCLGCHACVCTHCYYGARYCCPMVRLPPPPPLTRELTENKWEGAEKFMQENPLLQEYVVYRVPGRHIYKIVRDGMRLLRIHITLGR